MVALGGRLLLLPLLSLGVLSQGNPQNVVCVEALYKIYDYLTFSGIGYGKSYVQACRNPLKVTSIYAAAKTYCKPEDIGPGLHYLNGTCQDHSSVTLLPESVVATNLTEEAIQNMIVVDQDTTDEKKNLTAAVLISRQWFDRGYRTTDVAEAEKRTQQRYAFSMYGFWGGVLVLGMLNRFATYILESLQAKRLVHTEDSGLDGPRRKSSLERLLRPVTSRYSLARKFLTIPSALPPFHQQKLLGCTIPTRLESVVILSFWAISIILCSVNYTAFKENTYYHPISAQLWRYVANRAGSLAYANLPIMWMFSGRNNIFLWLTGWSFSTFNLFHRHVARVTTLEAIVHGIGYTAIYTTGDNDASVYRSKFENTWFIFGIVAVIAMSFIVLFSISWFRTKVYESFLLVHITLSVVTVVALFQHASKFNGTYNPYLWPIVAIWSFDRLLRITRVVYCNLHIYRRMGTSLRRTKATVTYVKEANVLIVDVTPAANHLGLGPGQHYYLYQPFRLTGWENHPFTLAYWSKPDASRLSMEGLEEPDRQAEKGFEATPPMTPTVPSPESAVSTVSEGGMPRLSFWIRPYDGWTRQLRDRCERSAQSAITTTLLAEGPYGRSEPLWMFDDVLMIAGGTGIAAVTPYLLDHIRRGSNPAGKPTTRTRSISLVWANRDEALLRRLGSTELSQALAHADITAAFYCTSRERAPARSSTDESTELEPASDGELSGELKHPHEVVRPRGVKRAIQHGRPDIRLAVEKAAAAAKDSGNCLAVMVCGPAGMADTARAAAYNAIRTCGVSLEYFEETFGW